MHVESRPSPARWPDRRTAPLLGGIGSLEEQRCSLAPGDKKNVRCVAGRAGANRANGGRSVLFPVEENGRCPRGHGVVMCQKGTHGVFHGVGRAFDGRSLCSSNRRNAAGNYTVLHSPEDSTEAPVADVHGGLPTKLKPTDRPASGSFPRAKPKK